MIFNIPKSVIDVLDILEQGGFEAYIVGGCVRDILAGIPAHDYDITTNALPENVKSLFSKTIDTGIKHGTVTVIYKGANLEITTYRTDGSYENSRRPNSVKFIRNINDDLARRDFTVNAICYSPKRGIVDLFGGLEDIKNRILKAVGEPQKRFHEDALRIFRLFRFSSVLNFSIEKETYNAALSCAPLLQKISRERIAGELIKTVCGVNISAVAPLIDSGALGFTGINHSNGLESISELSGNQNLRLFAFFKDCECNINEVSLELKLSNSIRNYLLHLDTLTSMALPKTDAQIKTMLNIADLTIFEDYCEYMSIVKKCDSKNILLCLNKIVENNEPYRISHLDINGKDLIALGYSGEETGHALDFLLKKAIENPKINKKSQLLKILEK